MHPDNSVSRGHPRPETRALWTMHTTCQHDCCRLSGIGPLMGEKRHGEARARNPPEPLHHRLLHKQHLVHSATSVAPPSFPWPGRSRRPAAPPAVGEGGRAGFQKTGQGNRRRDEDEQRWTALCRTRNSHHGTEWSTVLVSSTCQPPQLPLRIGPRQDVLVGGDGTGESTQQI